MKLVCSQLLVGNAPRNDRATFLRAPARRLPSVTERGAWLAEAHAAAPRRTRLTRARGDIAHRLGGVAETHVPNRRSSLSVWRQVEVHRCHYRRACRARDPRE